MARYLVTWQIDIEADTPEEAAVRALIVQRDPESTATYFKVDDPENCETITVDLSDDDTLAAAQKALTAD